MRVVLFGATGMVGEGVLIECLEAPDVESVLVIGRKSCGRTHAKLREVLRADFFDWSDAGELFAGLHACFFCLGVSAADMGAEEYYRLTFDITLAAARMMAELNPGSVFCCVSGQGTDGSEKGRVMWARVKGRTENAILAMPLKAYMLRPGYILPLGGIKSKTRVYRVFYQLMAPIYPVLRRLTPNLVTTNETVGRAMIELAASGYGSRVLEVRDINRVGRT